MILKNYDLKSLVLQLVPENALYKGDMCWIPLFHGTDRNVISMTKDERLSLRTACTSFIEYSYPIMRSFGVGKMKWNDPNGTFGVEHKRVLDAYIAAGSMMNSSKWYEHESFYVTANPDIAMNYAQRAYLNGELGYVADSLRLGLAALKWDYSDMNCQQKRALNIIIEAEAKANPDPIVLMYVGIPKNQIKDESGKPVNWDKRLDRFLNGCNIGNYRIVGDFDVLSGAIVEINTIPTLE